MIENVLIPLPGFTLPCDFPTRIGFVGLVEQQLAKLRATGRFVPARFFGYYFQGRVPMGVSGSWTVSLENVRPVSLLPEMLERVTGGKYRIVSRRASSPPDFLLVHDRRDGACWLWTFQEGLRFVESSEPMLGGRDGAETPKLSGP
ncbi:MAG: hypothetical protein ABIQ12_01700 [Opitutaceae bacterium]